MRPINTRELVLYILTVMRACWSRFRTVRSQARAFCLAAFVMFCGGLTVPTLANAKRRLEASLRDAGESRSQAVRIAAQTLRHFNRQKESSK